MKPANSAKHARSVRRQVQLAICKALKNRTSPHTPLVVAFSGGPDSTALALALHGLRLPFVLAHLDHSLRESSHREAEGHVRDVARRLGVRCIVDIADVAAFAREHRTGIEEAGRIVRYTFLERTRQSINAEWILLGHQADDLAEDVLLRLIRGAGWPSLAGMKAVDPKSRILRPFLHLPKATLLDFIDSENETCLLDPSNTSDAFRRNRLRNRVLPLLKQENPSFHRSISRLWERAREDESFWQMTLEPLLRIATRNGNAISLPEETIRPLHKAVRMRLYAALPGKLGTADTPLSPRADTLAALDKALFEQQRPKIFQLHGHVSCILAQGRLTCVLES